MKKQDWVNNLMIADITKVEKVCKLESACEYYITAGKCNGSNGNCQTCPITIARRKLLGRLPEERERVYAPKKPENTTVMFKAKNFTFNWKE